MAEPNTNEYLLAIFGARSITKTVIGYYGFLTEDVDSDLVPSDLLQKITMICNRENIDGAGLSMFSKIADLLIEFRGKTDRSISDQQLDSAKKLCESYVSWVFNSFPCFQKGEDGRFYFFAR